jgi:hypothetical protein
MFGKWFDSAYTGSMAGAGADVFAVWTYAIAKSDKDGYVELNPLVVAALIGMPVESVERAIEFLQQPDPKSRNPEHEGRRLIYQSGHLFVMVSKPIYRKKLDTDERREYLRTAQNDARGRSNYGIGYVYYAQSPIGIRIGFSQNPWARVKEMRGIAPDAQLLATEKATAQVEKERHQQFAADRIEREWFKSSPKLLRHIRNLCEHVVENPTTKLTTTATSTTSTHTDTDTDTDVVSNASHSHPAVGGERRRDPEEMIYRKYPRHEGYRAAMIAIGKATERLRQGESEVPPIPTKRAAQIYLYRRVEEYARSPAGTRPDKKKIPHPATWFNQSRYLDDDSEWKITGDENEKSKAQAQQARTHSAFERARIPLLDFEEAGAHRALDRGRSNDGEDRLDRG